MNFVASQKTVEDVFTSKKKMVIPRFQRQYVWGKDKLETLWDDILDNITYDKNKDKLLVTEYFLGSLVLIEKDDSIDRKVIDGQQRLTVFTIFFSAMYDIFHKEGKNDLADSIYGYVVTKNNDGEDVTLLETESPKPFFQSRIQSKNKDPESTPTGKEEERLLDTYNFFIKMLSKENIKIEFNTRFSKETDYIESLKIIRDQILRCKLVYVAVTTIEDAYMIFEVLNGKGEPLSSVDLIKNKIFEVLNNEAPLDKAKTLWNEIKTNIGKEEDLIKFYRNFWLSRYKFTQEKKLYHVFTKQIKKSKSNYNIFLKELKKSSFNYKKIINPSISDWNTNEKTSIYYNLNAFTIFNVTQVRTIILVLLDLYDKNRITLKILKRCLNFLERFHFVFSAICSERPSGLERKYSKYANKLFNELDKSKMSSIVNEFIEEMKKSIPLYEHFYEDFNKLWYTKEKTDDKKKIQYIFNKIEMKKLSTNELSIEDLSLEHILSQSTGGEDIGLIGNLLPLSSELNRECEDKNFTQKKEIYKRSNFKTVQEFCEKHKSKQEWKSEDIKKRTEQLANIMYHEICEF